MATPKKKKLMAVLAQQHFIYQFSAKSAEVW